VRRHFTLLDRRRAFNGADRARVTIELGHVPLFTVRPFRRRKTYTMALGDVAALVILKVVQAETRERLRLKKARR
jgi:hypothetical protein